MLRLLQEKGCVICCPAPCPLARGGFLFVPAVVSTWVITPGLTEAVVEAAPLFEKKFGELLTN